MGKKTEFWEQILETTFGKNQRHPGFCATPRKAVTLLAEAGAVQGTLHLPGVRDAYRWRLERVVLLGQTSNVAEFCEGTA